MMNNKWIKESYNGGHILDQLGLFETYWFSFCHLDDRYGYPNLNDE